MRTGRRIRKGNKMKQVGITRRGLGVKALAVAISAGSLFVLAARPASAGTIRGGGGSFGYSQINEAGADCHMVDGNLRRVMFVRPPMAFARDYRPGGGNDWAWVRFRTHLVTYPQGSPVVSNGWSGWARAWDNSSAQWSGTQSFHINGGGNYQVLVEIEWWNSTTKLGSLTWRVDRYRAYGFNWVPNGSSGQSC